MPELSQATDKFFQLCISLLHEENSIPALKEERAKWAGYHGDADRRAARRDFVVTKRDARAVCGSSPGR